MTNSLETSWWRELTLADIPKLKKTRYWLHTFYCWISVLQLISDTQKKYEKTLPDEVVRGLVEKYDVWVPHFIPRNLEWVLTNAYIKAVGFSSREECFAQIRSTWWAPTEEWYRKEYRPEQKDLGNKKETNNDWYRIAIWLILIAVLLFLMEDANASELDEKDLHDLIENTSDWISKIIVIENYLGEKNRGAINEHLYMSE